MRHGIFCFVAGLRRLVKRRAAGIRHTDHAGDLIEDFVQGAQKMRRESPALRAYNTTIKSFSTLTNQLISLLPEKEKKTAGDELMQFITKPKAAGR